ncbi:methyltransferase [Mycobacterium sp. B14F4]|uniref:methyltransferase n=1 Tax=Mycobacterium sp. B14F4 TaxID=3153565 RepID=UPI00325DB7B8
MATITVAAARIAERLRHHLYRLHLRLAPPPVSMVELILATWVSQAIQAAAELRVADALASGPLSLDHLARRVGADPDALGRLLRALISRGIFRQDRRGRYALNPLAETLRSDADVSMAAAARYYGSPQHREHWSMLVDSIRTGQASIPRLRGKEFFDYLDDEPELAELFNDTMTNISDLAVKSVVDAYPFSGTVVDVGGGYGRLLAAVLTAAPGTRGVLYDLPQVVANAPALLQKTGVADRVRIDGGSFFERVPADGDIYLLKHVIHDWPDEDAVAILRNVRAAAGPDARVLLVETVIPRHDRDFIGKWADLEMLLGGNGRERDADEYRALLRRSGFELTRIVPTASPFSLVEARVAPLAA